MLYVVDYCRILYIVNLNNLYFCVPRQCHVEVSPVQKWVTRDLFPLNMEEQDIITWYLSRTAESDIAFAFGGLYVSCSPLLGNKHLSDNFLP